MSRFVLGDCVPVMSAFPAAAVDFILTDPPYLVGFRDRSGRTLAGDTTDEWLQPACHEMYRVLKKDALMVSFYGWNRVDRFMAAWKAAGFHLRDWWHPTKDGYFKGVKHEQIVASLNEAGMAGAASDAAKMKKGDAADLAEDRLKDSLWVPTWLQAPQPVASDEDLNNTDIPAMAA